LTGGVPRSSIAAVHDVRLRPALATDVPRLGAIARAAKAHWGYAAELLELWRDDLTVTAAHVAGGALVCAVEGDEVVGFYGLSRDGATFELDHLWVDPAHMGRGSGARLFRHAVARARAQGGTLLRIASDPHAAGFYLRQGAVLVGEEPSRPAGRTLPLLVVTLA
jgi:GNAT superfamily N-acetyltransferase